MVGVDLLGLIYWLLFVMLNCDFVTFLFSIMGIMGKVWYLIVSIPDLCQLLTLIRTCFCTIIVYTEKQLEGI